MTSSYERLRLMQEIEATEAEMRKPVLASLLATAPIVAFNALWAGPIVGFLVWLTAGGLVGLAAKAGSPAWLVGLSGQAQALSRAMDGYWQSVWIGAVILVGLDVLRTVAFVVLAKRGMARVLRTMRRELAALGSEEHDSDDDQGRAKLLAEARKELSVQDEKPTPQKSSNKSSSANFDDMDPAYKPNLKLVLYVWQLEDLTLEQKCEKFFNLSQVIKSKLNRVPTPEELQSWKKLAEEEGVELGDGATFYHR